MAELVRRSLRMNPSRVIVGEVLGDEIVTMLNAMSQGNDGSLSTIHANSSLEVFNRICTYAIQSAERLPSDATMMLIAGAIDFVVFVERRNEYAARRRPAPHRHLGARGQRRRRPGAVQRGLRRGPGRASPCPRRRSSASTSCVAVGYQPGHAHAGWTAVTTARPPRPADRPPRRRRRRRRRCCSSTRCRAGARSSRSQPVEPSSLLPTLKRLGVAAAARRSAPAC